MDGLKKLNTISFGALLMVITGLIWENQNGIIVQDTGSLYIMIGFTLLGDILINMIHGFLMTLNLGMY